MIYRGKLALGIFKPDWKTSDYSKNGKALDAVEKETDQKKLAEMAKKAPLDNVRLAAIKKLTDQTLLADVIKNAYCGEYTGRNNNVCKVALEKLTDQTILADVAKNAREDKVRFVAAEKLTARNLAQEAFFNFVQTVPSSYVDLPDPVLEHVKKDQLSSDELSGRRLSLSVIAVNKLTDQNLLFAVATNSNLYHDIRLIAVKKLTDQRILLDIVNIPYDNCRGLYKERVEAVNKLTDQTILGNIAKNAKEDTNARVEAVNKLTDQTILTDVAKCFSSNSDRRGEVFFVVAERLTDQVLAQEIFAKIAKDSYHLPSMRLSATKKLTNQVLAQEVFAAIAKDVSRHPSLSLMAAEKLTDQVLAQETFVYIAKNTNDPQMRLKAVENLTDQEMLAYIAKNDNNIGVRLEAAKKLTDQTLAQKALADIKRNEKEIEEKGAEKFNASADLESSLAFLGSDAFRNEIERAKRARDQAERDKWINMGAPGAGKTHRCCLCRIETYGEETVIQKQQYALMQGNTYQAQKIEKQSAYRCKSCGKEYCKDCLEKKAPGNAYGGKSCPSCYGLFEIVHG